MQQTHFNLFELLMMLLSLLFGFGR